MEETLRRILKTKLIPLAVKHGKRGVMVWEYMAYSGIGDTACPRTNVSWRRSKGHYKDSEYHRNPWSQT